MNFRFGLVILAKDIKNTKGHMEWDILSSSAGFQIFLQNPLIFPIFSQKKKSSVKGFKGTMMTGYEEFNDHSRSISIILLKMIAILYFRLKMHEFFIRWLSNTYPANKWHRIISAHKHTLMPLFFVSFVDFVYRILSLLRDKLLSQGVVFCQIKYKNITHSSYRPVEEKVLFYSKA